MADAWPLAPDRRGRVAATPSHRSRSVAASTASGASTARRSATRGSRSSSPPACSAGWRWSWASPSSSVFPTPASRLEVDKLIGSIPASMVNLFGKPEKLGTLGGYMSWKYGADVRPRDRAVVDPRAVVDARRRGPPRQPRLRRRRAVRQAPDRAREARRAPDDARAGDGDPRGRHHGQLQRCSATPRSATRSRSLSSVGFALWVGFIALFFGGLAFALAPLLGRSGAAGVAGLAMIVLWVANGLDVLGPARGPEPVPLDGRPHRARRRVRLGGAGARRGRGGGLPRDRRRAVHCAATSASPPVCRSRGCRRSSSACAARSAARSAISCRGPWRGGSASGLMGALLASLVGPMADQIASSPDLLKVFSTIFPDFDLSSAGGFLQLYVQLFYIAAGFAGATFVSKWASDETDGRLEMVLATPISRARWVDRRRHRRDPRRRRGDRAVRGRDRPRRRIRRPGRRPSRCSARPRSACTRSRSSASVSRSAACGGRRWPPRSPSLVVVATYLIDLLAPPLHLPDWVHQLALTAHLGQPMIGEWDPVGVVALPGPRRRRRPARGVGHVPARPVRLSRARGRARPSEPLDPGLAERGPMMPSWT